MGSPLAFHVSWVVQTVTMTTKLQSLFWELNLYSNHEEPMGEKFIEMQVYFGTEMITA